MTSSSENAIEHLVSRLGDAWTITAVEEAGGGRGVFSEIWRVTIDGLEAILPAATVIAKLPVGGPNGQAARASGAYLREALAYEHLLLGSEPRHPRCLAIVRDDDNGASFLLEDLGHHRAVDQIVGLEPVEALRVVDGLAQLHRRFEGTPELGQMAVRRSAPAAFDPGALERGLRILARRVPPKQHKAFATLLDRRVELLAAFDAEDSVTLCHGDPRADNLVFDRVDGAALLFDWQQLAVQIGEADLAWLTGTSVAVTNRRGCEHALLQRYAGAVSRRLDDVERRYRLGFLLPGLAVLLLAQRATPDERTAAMVAASVDRIGTALVDLAVPDLLASG